MTTHKPAHTTGTLLHNTLLNYNTHHLSFTLQENMVFDAGQFVMITLQENNKILKRAYSVASAPWEKTLDFCIVTIPEGAVSGKINALKKDMVADIHGPFGHFTLAENKHDILFIATGTGIAPFRSIIRTLFKKYYSGTGTNTSKHIRLLFGTKTTEDLLYEEEWKTLAQTHKNFNYHITLTRETKEGYLSGRVQNNIKRLLTEQQDIYVCGLNNMVTEVKNLLAELQIPQEHIYTEQYG